MRLFIEHLPPVFRWMRAQNESGTDFANFLLSLSIIATAGDKVMSNSHVAENQKGIPPCLQREAKQKIKEKGNENGTSLRWSKRLRTLSVLGRGTGDRKRFPAVAGEM